MSVITVRSHTRIKRALLCLFAAGIGGTAVYDLTTFATMPLLISTALGLFLTMFLLATASGFVPWQKEPGAHLIAATLWGGGFAVLAAIAAERGIYAFLDANVIPMTNLFNVVVIAPVVEEIVKALGLVLLLLLLLIVRGRANPFMIALAVGLGFGTVENIQYFTSALTQYGFSHDYFTLLLGRGLVGPLLHATCAGITGLAVLWLRGRTRLLILPVVTTTLALAMLLHSVCNGAFGFVQSNYVESGLVVAGTVLLVLAYRRVTGVTPVTSTVK